MTARAAAAAPARELVVLMCTEASGPCAITAWATVRGAEVTYPGEAAARDTAAK